MNATTHPTWYTSLGSAWHARMDALSRSLGEHDDGSDVQILTDTELLEAAELWDELVPVLEEHDWPISAVEPVHLFAALLMVPLSRRGAAFGDLALELAHPPEVS